MLLQVVFVVLLIFCVNCNGFVCSWQYLVISVFVSMNIYVVQLIVLLFLCILILLIMLYVVIDMLVVNVVGSICVIWCWVLCLCFSLIVMIFVQISMSLFCVLKFRCLLVNVVVLSVMSSGVVLCVIGYVMVRLLCLYVWMSSSVQMMWIMVDVMMYSQFVGVIGVVVGRNSSVNSLIVICSIVVECSWLLLLCISVFYDVCRNVVYRMVNRMGIGMLNIF